MVFGHTTAEVSRVEGPAIEDAETIAWRATARTVVESGSETNSDAFAALAYVDGHVVVVTLVTDPGSADPPLETGYVTGLLKDAVAALRG